METDQEIDNPASLLRTDYWMSPVDDLIQAYSGDSRRASWRKGVLKFPTGHPAAGRIIGLEHDKLQIFSHAHRVADDAEMARRISSADFTGNVLFISADGSDPAPPPGAHQRHRETVTPEAFDANGLRAVVTLPPGTTSGWLFYADAWHPSWTASVNGKDVPLSRAFLAYKAVRLGPGKNVVDFRFRSPLRAAAFAALGWNALPWVILPLGLLLRRLLERGKR